MRRSVTFIPLILALVLALSACAPSQTAELLADGVQTAVDSLVNNNDAGTTTGAELAQEVVESATTSGSAAPPEVAAAQSGLLEDIYSKVSPSVVHIQVVQEQSSLPRGLPQIPGFPGLPEDGQPRQNRGEGSGFVWDHDGHIVTNNHVVAGASEITVIFADETMAEASLVGADDDSDLAVLRVDVPADRLSPVTLGDSTALRVGQLAVAIGNPFGQEGTMTVGIVSALGRLLPVDNGNPLAPRYNIPDVIQTDAAINPGNSGGVLLNDAGEVIGVTTAIISPARVASGVGFAVPAAIVEQVVPTLISEGEYVHPYLGLSGTSLTPEVAEAMELPSDQRGALVIETAPEGPAAESGLEDSQETATIDGREIPVGGDVIVAIDGEPIRGMDDLITYLARNTQVGQNVDLTVIRQGAETTVPVTLGARPQQDTAAAAREIRPAPVNRAWLGIAGRTLTPPVAEAMDLPSDQRGVLVSEVAPGGPAAEAGLLGGDETVTIDGVEVTIGGDVITAVDGESANSIQALVTQLSAYEPGDQITLQLLRDGQTEELTVTLGEWPE
ncbi:MAG: PDZ domain-containing protein [Candidatus Promineifilaceae bacterium]|nr:PDZ domain-containing protein [Candidatus Promineifilaceae bacterium]